MAKFIFNFRYTLKAVLILSGTFLTLPSAFAGNATDNCFLTNRTLQLDFVITLSEAFQVRDQVKNNYLAANSGNLSAAQKDLDNGILDVTKPPYNAKPNGVTDSTCALQRALLDARFARLVTYLPAGAAAYVISDQLQCVQNFINTEAGNNDKENAITVNGVEDEFRLAWKDFPCTLQGSTKAAVTIRLAYNSPGFNQKDANGNVIPDLAKAMVFFAGRSADNADTTTIDERRYFGPANSFNQSISNLSFRFSGSNAGAIAIDNIGAQGTVIENVNIDATNGFAGLRGLPGGGGNASHITVTNGTYGIYAVDQNTGCGTPTNPDNCYLTGEPSAAHVSSLVANLTLKGQSASPIYYQGRSSLTIVGAVIDANKSILAEGSALWNGHLNFVDSVIRFPSTVTNVPAIISNRNVFLRNVHTLYAGTVYKSSIGGTSAVTLTGNTTGWTHIAEYAVGGNNNDMTRYPIWVATTGAPVQQSASQSITRNTTAPGNLQAQHSWNVGSNIFPSWEDVGAINVRSFTCNGVTRGAAGDGISVDGDDIQAAIDCANANINNPTVFIPKGNYRIGKSLQLYAKTRIVGVGRMFSRIFPDRANGGSTFLTTPGQPLMQTLLASTSNTTALTAVGFLQFFATTDHAYMLRWQAGASSVVRNVTYNTKPWNVSATATRPSVLIDNATGGGRWFNTYLINPPTTQSASYRLLSVNGTRQALNFYMLNPEQHDLTPTHAYQAEFSNVQNVDVFGFKSEGTNTVLRISSSSNFRVFGHGGNATPAGAGVPLFQINNSNNYLLANLSQQWNDSGKIIVKEDSYTGAPGNQWLTVYKRGNPAN